MTVVARYCHRTGEKVDPDARPAVQRSDLSAPMIVRDVMDPTFNHADGQVHDSKSQYQRAVKDAGCEIVGNDSAFANPQPKAYKPKGVAQSIKDAYDQVTGT